MFGFFDIFLFKETTFQKEKAQYPMSVLLPVWLSASLTSPTLVCGRGVLTVCRVCLGTLTPQCSLEFFGVDLAYRTDVPLCILIPTIILVSLDAHQQCGCQVDSEGVIIHWLLQRYQNYPSLEHWKQRIGEIVGFL